MESCYKRENTVRSFLMDLRASNSSLMSIVSPKLSRLVAVLITYTSVFDSLISGTLYGSDDLNTVLIWVFFGIRDSKFSLFSSLGTNCLMFDFSYLQMGFRTTLIIILIVSSDNLSRNINYCPAIIFRKIH